MGARDSATAGASDKPAISGVVLTETSVALAVCVLVLVVAIILDRRPYRPGKLNYIPVMIIALAAILVFGRHLVLLRQ